MISSITSTKVGKTWSSLANKPSIIIIGLIASIIAIVVFISGKQSIGEFISKPTPISSNPIIVTVVVQPANDSTANSQVIVVTATKDKTSPVQPAPPTQQSVAPAQQLEPQFDPNDAEGFLRWYFHEVWATRNYDSLWDYLSADFRQRINLSYSDFETNWNAIGSVQEPIDISFEGQDGISLKYRVQYTTLSRKNGYTDKRRDLYWLYFNSSKRHWEFK